MSERKKNILRWLGIIALVATTTYVILLFAIPYAIMWIAITVLGNRMDANVLFHSERPNYDNQEIVRSSPDLIYSACTFDVSDHPIHLTAPLTGSYMSLSMYAMDTSCFFVRNDLQVPEGFDVVVLGADDGELKMDGTIIVRAPTDRGFLLFRNFAGNGAQVEKIETARRQAKIMELR